MTTTIQQRLIEQTFRPPARPVPIPRIAMKGMQGKDVAAYKRGLHFAGYKDPEFVWYGNPNFGVGMQHVTQRFQRDHDLVVDGQIGPITERLLWQHMDLYGKWELTTFKMAVPKPRTRFLNELEWCVANKNAIGYAMIRPIPLKAIHDRDLPFNTDCSGLCIGAAYEAGLQDPSGLHYSGYGNTDSLISALPSKLFHQLVPGDLIVYGPAGASDHVVACKSKNARGEWTVFSHGHTGSPEDPSLYPLSAFDSYFAGLPVHYLNLLG